MFQLFADPRGNVEFRSSRIWLALLATAFAVCVLSGAALCFRDAAHLPDTPIIEDAYYSLAVARHLALGNGLTYDGTAWTNGFQPFFTVFVCAPLYALVDGDRWAVLRGLYVVNAAVLALTAYLLAAIALDFRKSETPVGERRLRAALVAAGYVASTQIWRFHFNGLETGWLMLMYAASWLWFARAGVATYGRAAGFGALLGLVVLSRIDSALFVAIVAVGIARSEWGAGRAGLLRAGLVPGCAFLVSLPWWIYNYVGFGSLMPSSATAQGSSTMSVAKLSYMLGAVAQVATPALFVGQYEGILTTCARLVAFAAALVVIRIQSSRSTRDAGGTDPTTERTRAFGHYLFITYAVLAAYYLLQSRAWWFFPRYLAPAAMLGALFWCGIVLRMHGWVRNVALFAVLVLALQAPLFGALHLANRGFRGSSFFNDQLPLVLRHVPPSETVASGQSGTLGYWRDRVVNCDGKVNAEVLPLRRNLDHYLAQKRIHWWIDEGLFVNASSSWKPVATQADYGMTWTLYRRADVTP